MTLSQISRVVLNDVEGLRSLTTGGFFSNASRRKRRKKGIKRITPERYSAEEEELSSKEYRIRWAQLIRKIYEVDPLVCPGCGEDMRIVGIITERPVINRILDHLGLIEVKAHAPPDLDKEILELEHEPVYDDLPFDDEM